MPDWLIILVAVQRKLNQFSLLFWNGLIGCDILTRTTKFAMEGQSSWWEGQRSHGRSNVGLQALLPGAPSPETTYWWSCYWAGWGWAGTPADLRGVSALILSRTGHPVPPRGGWSAPAYSPVGPVQRLPGGKSRVAGEGGGGGGGNNPLMNASLITPSLFYCQQPSVWGHRSVSLVCL